MKLLISNSEQQQKNPEKSKNSKKKRSKQWLKWLCKPKYFHLLLQVGLFVFRIARLLQGVLAIFKIFKLLIQLGRD